jgi:transposase InsO family protein
LWVKQAAAAERDRPGHGLVAENRRLRAENHQLRLEREILKKADGLLRETQQMKFRFIAAEKARYPVRVLWHCLRVSRSGFYAWARRGPSERVRQDARLIAQLRLVHADSRQTYGRPRLCRALHARGIAGSGKRVARLMRVAGLRARGRRRFVVTTDSRHHCAIAPNRLQRRFQPRRLNRVWAADITACRLQHGWCYLAVVLDLASRRAIGWAVQRTPTPDLVIAALRPAIPRVPQRPTLLHHSDRGIQYASDRFRACLARHHITASMSRTGDCWDNAPVESFFSSFKAEASPDHPWLDVRAATAAIGAYIDFYNPRRLHSTLNYPTPVAFEARMARAV